MARPFGGREKRREPRVEVQLRVKGQLVDLDAPIVVHDLSRTGFAVVGRTAFTPGQILDFRLTGPAGPPMRVTAEAVHTSEVSGGIGLYLSGFRFVAGALTGCVPQSAIDRLIETVMDADRSFFGDGAAGFRTAG